MEKYFRYDISRYKKKLQIRFSIVLVLFIGFLVWNFLQIPDSDRTEFLALFLPMSILLGFFLFRSYQRQITMLRDVSVGIRDTKLIQFDKNVEVAEYNLTELNSIHEDRYKSFPRVVLEWEDHAVSFINLENSHLFVELLESITHLHAEKFTKPEGIFSLRASVFLLPSLAYALGVYFLEPRKIEYLNWETFFLFLNVNLIVYILYGTGDSSGKYSSLFESRRKILFVLLVLFIYQVFVQFSSALKLF